jgi:transcriptional regulator with XRE-family HTH domain
MSINVRIKELREKENLSVKEISTVLGIDSSQFGKVERGQLNPTVKLLMEISSKFNVSLDWLCFGTEDDSVLSKNVKVSSEVVKFDAQVPMVVTVDSAQRDNIVLVPQKAAAGYLAGYGDPEFINSLPSYRLPNIQNGTFRMFQIQGQSMYPTLHSGAYVVGQWCENWVKDIKDDRVYVIVSRSPESEGGVVVKRVLNRIKKYQSIFCKSDNRKEYPSYTIEVSDIVEVWEVKMTLQFDIPNPADLYDRVSDIEAQLLFLTQKLK